MNNGLYDDAEAMRRVTETVLLLKLREPQAGVLIALAEYLYASGAAQGLARLRTVFAPTVRVV